MMSMTEIPSHGRFSGRSFGLGSINRFLATPQYIALVALLTVLSNLFSLELPVYTAYAALGIYICLFAEDLLPLMPLLPLGYISPSARNNPGQHAETVFSGGSGVYVLVLGCALAAALVYRLLRDRKSLRRNHALLPGLLALSAAYLLGGIGSAGYGDKALKHLLFAGLQGTALCIPYGIFCAAVDWKKARRDYFAWIGFFFGCVLLAQILWAYTRPGVVVDGVIHRDSIYTGWGSYTNMGAMLTTAIPFAFYLAAKYRKGWLGTLVGSVFLFGAFLSCSRNAILVGGLCYLVSAAFMLLYARNRKCNTVAILTFAGLALAVVLLFHRQLAHLFSDLVSLKLDPNSRDSIYSQGLRLFADAPIFGSTFYPDGLWDWATVDAFSGIFPPRWHNTFVQLLASCGVVGLAAYLFHRGQTAWLFLRRHHREKTFLGCAVAALLICSLFDCHFFNIGPALIYAAALAFAENIRQA